MDNVIKACAGALVALVIGLVLTRQGKDVALMLTITVCCMLLTIAVEHLTPVISFLNRLQEVGDLDESLISVLLKAIGVGFVGEITSLICLDAGNSAMGKTIHILTACGILYLSLPLFESLLDLIEEVLSFI